MSFYTANGQQQQQQYQGGYQNPEMSNFSYAQGNMGGNRGNSFGNVGNGNPISYGYGDSSAGSGNRDEQLPAGLLNAFSTAGYSYEQPLLQELGINFQDIWQNTKRAILFKSKGITYQSQHSGDGQGGVTSGADLAGPLFFVLVYGLLLLLSGKLHFGYIYGVGLFGTVTLHVLFKLMSNQPLNLQLLQTASILGYSFLPLCLLSGIAVVTSLDNKLGFLTGFLFVIWCTSSSSGELVKVLQLHNARVLVGYPLFIFYTVFASMAIFV